MVRYTTAIASLYGAPLHVGHLEYLEKSKAIADRLIVIINNDQQMILKKGKIIIPAKDRYKLVSALRCVDECFLSIDTDATVCKSIEVVSLSCPNNKVIFCKGGDRNSSNIPEKEICDKLGIQIVDGLGEKIESSTRILEIMKD